MASDLYAQMHWSEQDTTAALNILKPWVLQQEAAARSGGKGKLQPPKLSHLAPDIRHLLLPILEAAGIPSPKKAAAGLQELRAAVVLVRNVAAHMPLPNTVTAVLGAGRYAQGLSSRGEWGFGFNATEGVCIRWRKVDRWGLAVLV
jgi:hypothetical protein